MCVKVVVRLCKLKETKLRVEEEVIFIEMCTEGIHIFLNCFRSILSCFVRFSELSAVGLVSFFRFFFREQKKPRNVQG
jgi:hypothetical protein